MRLKATTLSVKLTLSIVGGPQGNQLFFTCAFVEGIQYPQISYGEINLYNYNLFDTYFS